MNVCSACSAEFSEIIRYKNKKYCYDCLLYKLTNGKNKIDIEFAVKEIESLYREQKEKEKEKAIKDNFWYYIQEEYDIPKLSVRVFTIMNDMLAFGVQYDILSEMFKNQKVKNLMEKATQQKEFDSQEQKFLYHLQIVSGKYHKYKTERDRYLNRENENMTIESVLKMSKHIKFKKREDVNKLEEKYKYENILF